MLQLLVVVATAVSPGQEAPPGPVPGTRMTEAYVRQVAKSAYLWAWPMVNIHSRHAAYEKLPGPGYAGGVLPIAPPNYLCMLRDYIEPSERAVACPNQDVIYGQAVLDLAKEPVVVQVPDFGDRFFVYQIVDQRTDSFARIGKMYGTRMGFCLLAGPEWKGETPKGISQVFRSPTNVGFMIPRVFTEDTAEDNNDRDKNESQHDFKRPVVRSREVGRARRSARASARDGTVIGPVRRPTGPSRGPAARR